MQALRVASLVALALVGSLNAVDARTKDPSKFDVRMTGHLPRVYGGLQDQTMRFSVPVQVPGTVLPAGTYLFQFVTPQFIRVTSTDRKHVYATFMTVPISRNVTPLRGQARFQDRGNAEPLRLLAWYLPWSSIGNQPIYPKADRSTPLIAEN